MSNTKEFPFKKARRVSSKETSEAKKAIEKKTGKKQGIVMFQMGLLEKVHTLLKV